MKLLRHMSHRMGFVLALTLMAGTAHAAHSEKKVTPRKAPEIARFDAAEETCSAENENGAICVPPSPKRKLYPGYPRSARHVKAQGVVTIRVRIDEAGMVQAAKIVTSSGYAMLDQTALTAAKQRWRFSPAMIGIKPIAVYAQYRIEFLLRKH